MFLAYVHLTHSGDITKRLGVAEATAQGAKWLIDVT